MTIIITEAQQEELLDAPTFSEELEPIVLTSTVASSWQLPSIDESGDSLASIVFTPSSNLESHLSFAEST